MKNIIYLLFVLIGYTANSQNLSVFNTDAATFPIVKANFFAFDANGKQLTDFVKGDFNVTENGQPRTVTNIFCPSPKPPEVLSSVLVMDVSGSMFGSGLGIAKAAASEWINMLPMSNSECAITSFNDDNYLNQDFTRDPTKLLDGINSLSTFSGTDYNAALLDLYAGGILIAKTGKHKRVIVFLSDGGPTTETRTAEIISEANANNITIYCVTIAMSAPQCMKDFASQTGGMYFENIRTNEEAEECYRIIQLTAQGEEPCQIEWKSGISCLAGLTNVKLNLIPYNLTSYQEYQSPDNSFAQLEFKPSSVKFIKAIPGIKRDTLISIKAINADFNITNIKSTSSAFTITPTNFVLSNGQSRDFTVSYTPVDSGYTYCKFTFENDLCPTYYYASGGFPGKKPTLKTIKLIQPNGGEVFAAGMDTIITWEGVLPGDDVKLEYSIDNGAKWILITKSTNGLFYKWRVPKTPSNQCLARVTANGIYEPTCPDVTIGSQTWMGCNLDVEFYSNGDTIPEVKNPTEWKNLKTGAWCYYNNNPTMGPIYGKLYNWYAVNDPRGLAPQGWHVASDAEWTELETYLGGSTTAGGKLKTKGTLSGNNGLWNGPNTGATNSSGFSLIPGGFRYNDGKFSGLGNDADLWSSTESTPPYGWQRFITCSSAYVYRTYGFKEYGFSVRCVLD